MSNRVFVVGVILVVVLLNLYPLYQMATTGGYLFYQNAFDEPGYLNYDMAREYVNLSRITQVGEYLVVLGHQIGLSGGWINFILDVATTIAFMFGLRAVFKRVGIENGQANLLALIALVLPMVFLTPTLEGILLFDQYLKSDVLGWLVVWNGTNFLPFVRTPEPQVSYVILVFAVWLALRLRSFVPMYVCLPFLYSFVLITTLFVLLALHLRTRIEWFKRYPIIPPILSFLVVSALLAIYFGFVAGPSIKDAMTSLRSPLVSVAGISSLCVFAIGYRWLQVEHRYFVGLIALAPTAVMNQQLVSGWIAQPYNFELYAGVLCLVLVIILGFAQNKAAMIGFALVGLAAVAYSQVNPYGAFQFKFNEETNRPLKLNSDLLKALGTDSEHVVIADLNLASAASLVFPRQAATALAYQRTIGVSWVKENFASYLCARQVILENSRYAEDLRPAFQVLDHAFKYQGLDYRLLHLGSKTEFEVKNDPLAQPQHCSPARYWILTQSGQIERLDAVGLKNDQR